jgi:hypothetical protein
MKRLSTLFILVLSAAMTASFGKSVTITLTSSSKVLQNSDYSAALASAGATRSEVTELKLLSANSEAYWGITNCKSVAVYFDSTACPALDVLDLSEAVFLDNAIPNNAVTSSSTFGKSAAAGATTNGMAFTTVILPDNLVSIGERAFLNALKLKHINLPDGLKRIYTGAFQGCAEMELNSLPESITNLGVSAFNGCKKISLTSLPSGLTSLPNYAFSGCSNMIVSEIPNGITLIGNQTFMNCRKITEVTFPAGLDSIGTKAFSGDSLITKLVFQGTTPPKIVASTTSVFSKIEQIDVIVPAGALTGTTPWTTARANKQPWKSFKSITEATSVGLNPSAVAEKTIRIYPAIATAEIHLLGSAASTARIYSATGQEVLKADLPSDQDNTISVAQLSPGLYLLKTGESTLKFIKK